MQWAKANNRQICNGPIDGILLCLKINDKQINKAEKEKQEEEEEEVKRSV